MRTGFLLGTLVGLLASANAAGPTSPKAKNPIGDVLDKLNSGIQKTDRDIRLWRGDLAGSELLFADANYLLNDIRQGAVVVQSVPPLKIFDGWLEPALRLDRNLDSLVNSVISQKSRIEKINRGQDITRVLSDMKIGVDGLVKNIFAKLPTPAQALARPVSNNIVGKVDKAIRAYDGGRRNPLAPNLPSNPLKSSGGTKGGNAPPSGGWASGPAQAAPFGNSAAPAPAPDPFPAALPASGPSFSASQAQAAPGEPWASAAKSSSPLPPAAISQPGGAQWSPQGQNVGGPWSPAKGSKKGFRRSRLV